MNIENLTREALRLSLFESMEPSVSVGEGENKVTIPLVFVENLIKLISLDRL